MPTQYDITYDPFIDNFNEDNPPQGGGLIVSYQADFDPRNAASPIESFDRDTGGKATRIFKVAWSDRMAAVQQILGFAAYTPNPNQAPGPDATFLGGTINRHMPEVHPDYPWMIAVRVSRIQGLGPINTGRDNTLSFELKGNGRKIIKYKHALLTVEYEAIDYAVRSDNEMAQYQINPGSGAMNVELQRYVVAEFKPQADYVSVPGCFYLYAEGPGKQKSEKFPGNVGKMNIAADLRLTWKQVPIKAAPIAFMYRALGKVNKYIFINQDPHTLLFTSADLRRKRQSNGKLVWDIEYNFKFQQLGFNKFYRFASDLSTFGPYQISIDGNPYVPPFPDPPPGVLPFDETEYHRFFVPA